MKKKNFVQIVALVLMVLPNLVKAQTETSDQQGPCVAGYTYNQKTGLCERIQDDSGAGNGARNGDGNGSSVAPTMCASGYYYISNSQLNGCYPRANCMEGYVYDGLTRLCYSINGKDKSTPVLSQIRCEPGYVYNSDQHGCVKITCQKGYIADFKTGMCIRKDFYAEYKTKNKPDDCYTALRMSKLLDVVQLDKNGNISKDNPFNSKAKKFVSSESGQPGCYNFVMKKNMLSKEKLNGELCFAQNSSNVVTFFNVRNSRNIVQDSCSVPKPEDYHPGVSTSNDSGGSTSIGK